MEGFITDDDARFVETWENIAGITNYVIRLDMRGEERPEAVNGKRTFMISTKERKITQDRILEKKNDPFLNGAFRPVIVPDSVNIESNPNALSDDEIKSIFVSSELAWDEWMNTIDSGETLRRMLDLADGADITLKRFRQLEARLEAVNPPKRITQRDQEEYDKLGPTGAPGGSGPGGGVKNRPRVGGGGV